MTTCLNNTKLIVCDIDGTLTHTGTIMPDDYTLKVIEKVHDKGIYFGLGSGRDAAQLIHLKEEWNLSFPFDMVIGLNGSEYYDHKRNMIKELYTLEKQDIEQIITKMLDKFPDLNCSIYRNGVRYLRFEDEMAIMSKLRNKMNNHYVEDLSEMWAENCPKVMFRVTEEVMAQIEPYALKISNERFRACKTQTTMLEFVHRSANKGSALKAYCDDNGIDLKDVVTFGDMSNDKEMLEVAGTGVCMCNGSQDCKQSADMISDYSNDENGCARFIEQYIL